MTPTLAGDPFELRTFDLALPLDRVGSTDFSQSVRLDLTGSIGRTLPARSAGRFFDGHLMPGLARSFEKLTPFHRVNEPTNLYADPVYFDTHTELAHHRTSRAARRAVKNYLLEKGPFNGITRLLEAGRDSMPGTARQDRERVRFGVGGSGGAPVAYLRYERASHSLRLSLDARGVSRLEIHRGRMDRVRLAAEFDIPDGEYGLNCRLHF